MVTATAKERFTKLAVRVTDFAKNVHSEAYFSRGSEVAMNLYGEISAEIADLACELWNPSLAVMETLMDIVLEAITCPKSEYGKKEQEIWKNTDSFCQVIMQDCHKHIREVRRK